MAALAAVALAGCGDPIPPEQWKQGEVSLQTVAGFEDCRMAKLKFHENGQPVLLIRCPLSQVSINETIPQGKARVNQATAVVEADMQAERDAQRKAKIDMIEGNMKRLQAELNELKK